MRIPHWVATVSIETFGSRQIDFRKKDDECWKTLINLTFFSFVYIFYRRIPLIIKFYFYFIPRIIR